MKVLDFLIRRVSGGQFIVVPGVWCQVGRFKSTGLNSTRAQCSKPERISDWRFQVLFGYLEVMIVETLRLSDGRGLWGPVFREML